MSGEKGFAALPYAFQDVCFDRTAHYVYGWLRRYSDWNTGEMRATLIEVASRSKCDIGTIRRALKILKSVGAAELIGDAGRQRWKIYPNRDEPHLKKTGDGGSPLRGSPTTIVADYHRNGLRGSPGRGVQHAPVTDAPRVVSETADPPHVDAPESDLGNGEIRSVSRSDLVSDLLSEWDLQGDQKLTKKTDQRDDRGGDLKGEPKTKPQAQPTLSLSAVTPTKIDPATLLRGDHDSRRDRAVIEATVALWASVWSRNPSLAAVTKDRERIWRDAVKTYPPSAFAKAVIGMWWDPSPADRTKFHEFTHVARALETWVGLYDQHGDPRDRAGFSPGCPPPKSPAPGGGRGGDRAHGGSGEVLSGQAALDKVAAETRERAERDRKQREEANTPEALEARRLAFEAMDALKARKGGRR